MFGVPRALDPHTPSSAICRVIELNGLPPGVSKASMLRVVESDGRYSGRKVTFVRIFDPMRAAAGAVTVERFDDLDAHQSLVLWSGHVERDGSLAISHRALGVDRPTPGRILADRAAHADDERFVFHGRDAARSGQPQ
jgi:hypothetical protein